MAEIKFEGIRTIQELYLIRDSFEKHERNFIETIVKNINPYDIAGEITDKQIDWIKKLQKKYFP